MTSFVHCTHIYGLCDPDTGSIRYVGKSDRPAVRLRAHISECRSTGEHHRARWIRSLLSQSKEPLLLVLDDVPVDEWQAWERSWISVLREAGFNLTNDCDGGEGREGPLSRVTRERIRVAHLGKPVNPLGQPLTANHRAAISAAMRGNRNVVGKHWVLSEETKDKHRARARSEEGRRSRSLASLGRWAAERGGGARG